MLFRAVVELNDSIQSFSLFNVSNQDVSRAISEKYLNQAKIMVSHFREEVANIIGSISDELLLEMTREQLVNEFMQEVKISGEIKSLNEITTGDFWRSVNAVITRNSENIQEAMELSEEEWLKYAPKLSRMNFTEHLVHPQDAEYDEGVLYSTSLGEEITRISSNRNKKFIGHPVHYTTHYSNDKQKIRLHDKLAAILNKNDRLLSMRVLVFRFEATYENMYLETGMMIAKGGSMIIDLDDEDFTEIGQNRLERLMTEIVRQMRLNEHKVLFNVCYKDEKGRAYQAFMEKALGFTFVKIEPKLMNYDQAVTLVKQEAKRYGLSSNKFIHLINKKQKMFSQNEISAMFSLEHSNLLKEKFFTEYQHITVTQEMVKDEDRGEAYRELQSLIGLDFVKEFIDSFLSYQRALPVMLEMGLKPPIMSKHMLFAGNPGTAKTTVARLIGKIMRDNGLLKIGNFIEVGRSDLVAEYVGQTAVKVKNVFERAKGSVLFIDEAYSLYDEGKIQYGSEALATIVQEMENNRDEVMVIFAGYPSEMEQLVNKNPGLRSRVGYTLNFNDYQADDLVRIAEKLFTEAGFIVEKEALSVIEEICDAATSKVNFGNGRFARNMVEAIILHHVYQITSWENISKEDAVTIKVSDIEVETFPQNDTSYKKESSSSLN